jgi:hypothetical protein
MIAKLLKLMLFVVLSVSPLLLQAQTTYNLNPEIVSGQAYYNDGIVSDITDVPTNNPYLNGHSVDGTTVLKIGRSASTGASFVTNAIIPFKLPERPSGKLVVAANLKVNIAYLRHWIDANADLYGLPYNASATINSSDYYDGTYSDPTGTVTAIQSGFIVRDTGDTEPLGTQILTDREVNSNASGDAALLAYINAQYDAGASAGDYVFLRMSINVSTASVPNGLLGGHYYGISDGQTANAPELLLEIEDADPGAVASADFTITTPAADGYVSDPGIIVANNPFLSGAAKLGKSAVDGSANLTSVILPFELPARPAGETVDFANLNVYVSFGRQFVNANVDLHGLTFKQSIANGGTGSAISSADHFGGAYPDVTGGVTAIEDDYFTKNVASGSLDTPRWEETTAEANLTAYLNAQYDAGAVAGDWVFLRLNMDNAAMTGAQFFNIDGGDSANPAALEIGFTSSAATNTWNGGSTDWATPTNWSEGTVPTAAENVVIPDLANDPIIGATTAAVANDIATNGVLTIASGGSLIVSGTATGNVTYNRTLTAKAADADGWHLISSPVVGQDYNNAYATTNGLATSSTDITRRGLATYNDANDPKFDYLLTNDSNSGTFTSGIGYSAKIASSGTVSFTGTINTADVNGVAVSAAADEFVLLGVPYTSYMSSQTFLAANTNLDQTQIWVWEQGVTGGNYIVGTALADNFILAPGQGFFIKKANTGATVNFTESNQSGYDTEDTFKKSSRTEVKLLMNDGENNRFAKLYYVNNVTKGFDAGWEGETFSGIKNSIDVFSQLVEDNQGKNYQVQSLPIAEMEAITVPVGIIAEAGKEITFAAESLNLTSGIKVFLEDRVTNTFTRLDEANSEYKVTPKEALNGIGRFYLHTKQISLSLSDVDLLESVSIYSLNNSTIRIAGLPEGKVNMKLHNILGKESMNISFEANGVKDLSLPRLSSGVYIVQLETAKGKLNKKIILE